MQETSAGAVETKIEGCRSVRAPIEIVLGCSVGLFVVGELVRKEGLARLDVRLNVTTVNLHCSAMD